MTSVRRAAVPAAIAALISGAPIATTAGAASDVSSPSRMTAVLRSEASGATGRFYARVAPYGDRAQLHFNFTYPPTGPAFRWPYPGVAHIHLGRPTAPERVVIDLCSGSIGCGYGFAWSESYPYALVNRMRGRGAYVELHPRSSRAATLRGQLVFR